MAGKWKHGWVPEDTQAALEKAHGSKSGANTVLSGKRKAPARPKTPPKVKNPGGRNMQDLSAPKGIKTPPGGIGVVDLGKLPPGFGRNKRAK